MKQYLPKITYPKHNYKAKKNTKRKSVVPPNQIFTSFGGMSYGLFDCNTRISETLPRTSSITPENNADFDVEPFAFDALPIQPETYRSTLN
jgi:hypothetical protein